MSSDERKAYAAAKAAFDEYIGYDEYRSPSAEEVLEISHAYIAALEAENAALRSALEQIAEYTQPYADDAQEAGN